MNLSEDFPYLQFPGLPDSCAALLPGGVYFIQADSPEALADMLSRTLTSTNAALLTQYPDYPLRENARKTWREGQLPLMQLAGKVDDTPRLLWEMEQTGLQHRSLLVLLGHRLGVLDAQGHFLPGVLARLQQWAVRHDTAVLLIQQQGWRIHPEAGKRLGPALLSGLARLDSESGERMWRVFHWASPMGISAARQFRLQPGEPLAVAADEVPDTRLEALDRELVLASQAAVDDMIDRPDHWQVVPENANLLEQGRSTAGAVFLLNYSAHGRFAQLARQIQGLRLRLGRAIRIVVRERGAVLRHAQMVLLRKLGCNLLIPAELPPSRLQTLLESVENIRDTAFYPEEIEPLLLALNPFETRGYLPLPEFVQRLQQVLQSVSERLEAVLVRLELLPGIEPQQALSAITLQRSGDVATADEDAVWLYLHGCQPSQVATALEHVTQLPLDSLFASQLHVPDPLDMREQLDALRKKAEQGLWEDYSPMLVGLPVEADQEADTGSLWGFRPEPLSPAVAAPLQKKPRHDTTR